MELPFYGDRPGARLRLTLNGRFDRSLDGMMVTLELDLSDTSFQAFPNVTILDVTLDQISRHVSTWPSAPPFDDRSQKVDRLYVWGQFPSSR